MARYGKPLRPAIDAMLTMWPVRRGTIRRIASCVPWMTACRLMSSWRVMLVRALVVERRDGHDPGVVDEHVERAEALLDLVEERGEAGVVGDVEREADRAGSPSSAAVCSADSRSRSPTRHAGALARERLRDGAADAAAAAGDDDDLSGQRAGFLAMA